jgi:signal transduction histidine kinase/signal recognition particle receptor subunit beta
MGFINLADKTISAKLVYYGVGMGGKTTSLQAVHQVLCPRDEVSLVTINTEDDSTLLFDFLPIDLGQVEGFKIRIQGFTVPGQPKYKRMRKYVLQGADAVVFVVDSQTSRLEENHKSLLTLRQNLHANGLDPETIPLLLQYNKRDLADVLPEAELDRQFKWRDGLESFPSVASEGRGVFETFVHAAGLLVEAKVRAYGLGRGEVSPEHVADGTRKKLWEIYDRALGDEENAKTPRVAVTVVERDGALCGEADQAAHPAPLDGQVFSEEELDQDLGVVDFAIEQSATEDEEPKRILEEVIEANVELAKHFGDLDHYKSLLERKNRELVHVAQNTVHDLNRPLSVIKLMMTSMQRGLFGEVPQKMAAAIDNGMLAIRQMERLVRDLLDSSRLDFDGVQLRFQEVDMTLLVAEIVRSMCFEIEEKDIVMQVEQLPKIIGDEWALTRAFSNLLGNAVQYVHPERRPRIRVGAESSDDGWIFTVEDNGIGIPEQDAGRLFRRFERGSNTAGVSGTGLGLHIVREVVLGHGGTVWVESEQDVGSRFRMLLPFEPVMPPHSSVSDVAVG